jgi:hypothetical protein
MTTQQLKDLRKKQEANLPKMTDKKCRMCDNFLTDVNIFFQKTTCSTCEPIYLLHQNKNTWTPQDEILVNDLKL